MTNFFVKTELILHLSAELLKNTASPRHTHDLWQMELFKSGEVHGYIGGEIFHFKTGDIVIVPPGVEHFFRYDTDSAIVSIRFKIVGGHAPEQTAMVLPDMPLKQIITQIFMTLGGNGNLLDTAERIFIEHTLAAIITVCGLKVPNREKNIHPAFTKAVDFIERNRNRYLPIYKIAAAAGCSMGHLSMLFRRYDGVSLKCYVDNVRAELIKQYLVYSDLSITRIAAETGFEDVYSFSRFFKRATGITPNLFRRHR